MISVIIPVFNMRSLVGDTLRSVVAQSCSDLEIVCVDDGSTDGSGDLLAEWARRDDRIRVISRENGGLGAARNTGLEMANGEWIAFLDAGDVGFVCPDAFRKFGLSHLSFLSCLLNDGSRIECISFIFKCSSFLTASRSIFPIQYLAVVPNLVIVCLHNNHFSISLLSLVLAAGFSVISY